MSLEHLKQKARRIPEELVTQGDLQVADLVFAPELVLHGPCGSVPGTGNLKQSVTALRRAFPDLWAVIEDEIAEGNRLAQRLTLAGTHLGRYLGQEPTGRRATWSLVAMYAVDNNGLVTEQWLYTDLLGLLAQLGAFPPSVTTTATAGGDAP